MQVIHSISEIRQVLSNAESVVLVPTMGNLHDGHLSLVRTAKQYGKTVVVSIFVNPIQFGPTEDFDRYPRTLEADCEKLAAIGTDIVFAPSVEEMYAQQQHCFVVPTAGVDCLEGKTRPGHFQGVATVVLKLFNIVQPQAAIFGKKDYQQFRMIESMVQQLNLPIQIVGVPTARAEDGLALSSRNGYLSKEERQEAPWLHAVLQTIRASIAQGETNYEQLISNALDTLRQRGWKPDYIAIRQQQNLAQSATPNTASVVLAAATLGKTRLIDNIELD